MGISTLRAGAAGEQLAHGGGDHFGLVEEDMVAAFPGDNKGAVRMVRGQLAL
jgi:hypothetical protein